MVGGGYNQPEGGLSGGISGAVMGKMRIRQAIKPSFLGFKEKNLPAAGESSKIQECHKGKGGLIDRKGIRMHAQKKETPHHLDPTQGKKGGDLIEEGTHN